MKTILVLANNDVGLYKFRLAILKRFKSDGFRVVAALPDEGHTSPITDAGIELINTPMERRGMNPAKDLGLLKQYMRILKDVKPDLVVAYTVKPDVYGGLACRLKNVPFAANITGLGSAIEGGGKLRRLVLAMYRTALKKAKIVFFENEGNREVFLNEKVVKKEKTRVLHGAGIDTAEYPFEEYPETDKTEFLFVGRIMKEKGVDELFKAAARLKKEYSDKVIFTLVGMFEDAYEEKVNELSKADIIRYEGFHADVRPFYATCSCLVLPSWHEGMSNVLLEAGATGRPIITSNIHGCMEAVEDGKTGCICEVKNAESLYEKMKTFLELPTEKRTEMGRASREHITRNFEKAKVVEETVKYLY